MAGDNPLGTILSVGAHPDDETYLCGGLMARATRAGSRVVCVTATRGELGSPDEERWPSGPPLAALRTREMESALAELGVTEHMWLDYPDGGCADVPDAEAVARITALMTDVRPDTVLTFGPDGMTGHPDHISVGRWTTAAFDAAPDGATLGYATNTPGWLARWRDPLDELNVFMGAEPPSTPVDELLIHDVFEGELLEATVRAIRRQTSQVEPLVHALGDAMLYEGLAEEAFRRPG
ncbi:MAG: PIG-L deacetylase family protein [Actinomycetes bacterium]